MNVLMNSDEWIKMNEWMIISKEYTEKNERMKEWIKWKEYKDKVKPN